MSLSHWAGRNPLGQGWVLRICVSHFVFPEPQAQASPLPPPAPCVESTVLPPGTLGVTPTKEPLSNPALALSG